MSLNNGFSTCHIKIRKDWINSVIKDQENYELDEFLLALRMKSGFNREDICKILKIRTHRTFMIESGRTTKHATSSEIRKFSYFYGVSLKLLSKKRKKFIDKYSDLPKYEKTDLVKNRTPKGQFMPADI